MSATEIQNLQDGFVLFNGFFIEFALMTVLVQALFIALIFLFSPREIKRVQIVSRYDA